MRTAALTCSKGTYILPDGTKSHFSVGEFRCPCGKCDFTAVDVKLIEGLEMLRKTLNTRLKVISGIRCDAHNTAIYEAKGQTPTKSQHIPDADGIAGAADILALDGPGSGDLFLEAQALKWTHLHGRGLGPTTLHVDTGGVRSWSYGKHAGEKPESWIGALIKNDWER